MGQPGDARLAEEECSSTRSELDGAHRGQVASDVRASGGVPAYTDYIHALRQGLIE